MAFTICKVNIFNKEWERRKKAKKDLFGTEKAKQKRGYLLINNSFQVKWFPSRVQAMNEIDVYGK